MASISKTPNQTWRVRYRDGEGNNISRNFKTRREAQAWAAAQTVSIATGTHLSPRAGHITFNNYAQLWKRHQHHRPATVETVNSVVSYALPVWGDLSLRAITRTHAEELFSSLRFDRQLSPARLRLAHRVLSAIFRRAVTELEIPINPLADLRLPAVMKRQIVPLEARNIWKLAAAVPPKQKMLIVLAASTGMRQGEIFGLSADRIDFSRLSLRIDRQLVTGLDGQPKFGPPKTTASLRTVPISAAISKELEAHMEAFPPTDTGLIFSNSQGRCWRRAPWNRMWRQACCEARMPDGLRFHDLRHFYASLLIRYGASVKTVQVMLGHASAVETLDTYSHLWADGYEQVRSAVETGLLEAGDGFVTNKDE